MMIGNSDYENLRVWTKQYIEDKCLIRNTRMPGKLPGTTYTWIFYLRNGLFNHEFLSAISQMFIYKIQKEIGHFDFQITGLETASTPMLASIPLIARIFNYDINSFSIRKERKEYGLMNIIEGIPNNKPCLILDDLCNSSVSMKKAYDVLTEEKIEILNYAFCIVNKVNKNIHHQNRQTTDMYLPENIKVLSLFDLDDFNLTGASH
jgi:orotate phosphoribosyltransferase